MIIGFPRTLSYYSYYPFWHIFFRGLGCKVVLSKPTSKVTLDLGIKEAVNDACLPVKLYHGHVAELKDRADLLFLPRMVSVRKGKGETFCPKFLGLPDMIKNSFDRLPPIVDDKIDLRHSPLALWELCHKLAARLSCNSFTAWQAYNKALKVQAHFVRTMTRGIPAPEAIELALGGKAYEKPPGPQPDLNLAIVGYPYVVYDSYISAGLLGRLAGMGIKAWMVETVPCNRLAYQARYFPKNLFWFFSNQVVRAGMYYIKEQRVEGIVHVTAFGCGPDAIVGKLLELECKSHQVPFLNLSLDEHTGEVGVITRIEAFADMIRIRRGHVQGFCSVGQMNRTTD